MKSWATKSCHCVSSPLPSFARCASTSTLQRIPRWPPVSPPRRFARRQPPDVVAANSPPGAFYSHQPRNPKYKWWRAAATTMTTTVELATVPSADTPGTCLYIHNQKHSYLVGRLADGTQRAFNSRKISMGGTEHIFLSGPVGGAETGGLVGYMLSVGGTLENARESHAHENDRRRESGLKPLPPVKHGGISVHGGDNLSHVLATYRPVLLRQGIKLKLREHREDDGSDPDAAREPDWKDDAIRVWKVPVRRARSTSPPKRSHDSIDAPDDATSGSPPPAKPVSQLSDPDVAALIVENIMFNGNVGTGTSLPARKIRDLKPDDVAIVNIKGTLKAYNPKRAAETKTELDPDKPAYMFEGAISNERMLEKNEDGVSPFNINSHPLPSTCYSQTSTSYIIKCHDRRGTFNPTAAKELGVRKEHFKLLTQGVTVDGTDGIEVRPDMVLGPMQPGNGIIVADIPSHDFVDSFLARPEWQCSQLMHHIVTIFWILGPGLAEDPQIQAFIQRYPQTKHIFCAEDTCPNMITHPSPAELQVKLRRIDPERYPLPVFDNAVKFPAPPADSPIELGRAGRKLHLMPRLTHNHENIAPFPDLAEAVQAVEEDVLELAEQARTASSDPEFLARVEEMEKDIPSRDAEIIPLGTGSSIPSKYRNVSGTLIRVPGIGNYLLDCGEGSLGQILRAFGSEETADILRNLKCIVISHLHADHHMGVMGLIKAWYEQTLKDKSTANLAISCIYKYRIMLEELAQVQDVGFHRLRFPNCPTGTWKGKDHVTADDLGAENFGLASILRVPVPHCWLSFATQLELTSGLRIAYSGDCRPSAPFAQACRGAHLLVHECTFGDDRADHARAKRHSTMGEALGVARDMRARRVLLTHFSQRYTKADSLSAHARVGDGDGEQRVLLATDMMRVRLGDFQRAACYAPAVQALLENLGDERSGAPA